MDEKDIPDYYLCGIVVHVGSLDSGHYYIFLKKLIGEKVEWVEFNDRDVHIREEDLMMDMVQGLEFDSISYDKEVRVSKSNY